MHTHEKILTSLEWDGQEEVENGFLKYLLVRSGEGVVEFLHLESGAKLPLHKHEHSSAMIYVLEGCGKAIVGVDKPTPPVSYKKGDSFFIPATHWHEFFATSTTVLLAVQDKSTEYDTILYSSSSNLG